MNSRKLKLERLQDRVLFTVDIMGCDDPVDPNAYDAYLAHDLHDDAGEMLSQGGGVIPLGDFNGDGTVDLADFAMLSDHLEIGFGDVEDGGAAVGFEGYCADHEADFNIAEFLDRVVDDLLNGNELVDVTVDHTHIGDQNEDGFLTSAGSIASVNPDDGLTSGDEVDVTVDHTHLDSLFGDFAA